MLLVTLGTLSVLGGIIDKGTTCCSINAFLQVVAQMLIGLVKELVIVFFTDKFTQTLVGNGLMSDTGFHIVNIFVVVKNDVHLSCGCVIPTFGLAPTLLHRCIGVCDFVHVLNDIDVRVQFFTHLLGGSAHHVTVRLHGALHLSVECVHLLISDGTCLSMLWLAACCLYHCINLAGLQDAVHLHGSSDNPRVGVRVGIGAVLIGSVDWYTWQSCKGVLVLAVGIHAVTPCFLVVVNIVSILHLCPHEVCREQLALSCFGVDAVELECVRYLAKMPSGTIG